MSMKRSKKIAVRWSQTPEGLAAHAAVRAAAQLEANKTGFDYGIEANDLFKYWRFFPLPAKAFRFGHEHTCEVVSCERLDRCQPGHGPLATREPSRVGPDYHGGPWPVKAV
jgi:hypothetical protein